MSWKYCTSGAAIARAGKFYDTGMSGAEFNNFSEQAEGTINTETRRDWGAEPPNANMSGALARVEAAMVGNDLIYRNMSPFTSRFEAGLMLDVNADIVRKGINILKKKEDQEIN